MTSIAPASPIAGALFAELFDDDLVTRPDAPALDDAFSIHRLALEGAYRWTVGALTLPTSALEHLASVAARFGNRLRLGLVVDDATADGERMAALIDDHGWAVRSLTMFLADAEVADHAANVRHVADTIGAGEAYLELPWSEFPSGGVTAAIKAAATAGVGVTLRCGGESHDSIPAATLAEVIAAAADTGAPLRLSGLHHPFRHPDAAPGVVSHGFVNVLAAAIVAASGAPAGEVAEVIAEDDSQSFSVASHSFAWNAVRADHTAVTEVRKRLLRAIGVENLRDPIDDLVAMDILENA